MINKPANDHTQILNIVDYMEPEDPQDTADELLIDLLGQYKDVIVIGITDDAPVYYSTVGEEKAYLTLARAVAWIMQEYLLPGE